MRKWLKHIRDLNIAADTRIFIKNSTMAMIAASMYASFAKMATMLVGDAEAFLEKNETQQFAIHDKFNNHLNDRDIIQTFYVELPAFCILSSLIITAIEIMNHHHGWKKYATQQRKMNTSNLDDLEEKAQDYYKNLGGVIYTYRYQLKNILTQFHPIHLCDEKGALLYPPAIVSNKGTVHSLEEFKQLAENKIHSPCGIIDLELTEEIIKYLKNEPLNFKTIPLPKTFSLWQKVYFYVLNLSDESLRGMVYTLKRIIPGFLICFSFYSFIVFSMKFINPRIASSDFITDLTRIYVLSIASTIGLTSYHLLESLYKWFDRKNTLSDAKASISSLRVQIPSLFLCSTTKRPLKKAVIQENGLVYSEDALDKYYAYHGYPLVWSYNRRQKQVDQFLQSQHDEKVHVNRIKTN